MDERKVTNNWNFGDIGANAVLLFILIGMGLVTLVVLAIKGVLAAIVILAVLITLFLITFGVFLTLVIMARVHKHEQKRTEAEQSRFRDNTIENLGVLEQQARAQLAQAKAQDQQWRVIRNEVDTYRKMTPAGNGEPVGLDYDDSIFDALGD